MERRKIITVITLVITKYYFKKSIATMLLEHLQ